VYDNAAVHHVSVAEQGYSSPIKQEYCEEEKAKESYLFLASLHFIMPCFSLDAFLIFDSVKYY